MSTKQVIVLRKDLNMRKGKMVAQGSHASLGAYFKATEIPYSGALSPHAVNVYSWLNDSLQTKVCVGVDSEEELLAVFKQAQDAGLPAKLVLDAGKTEFSEPTYTAVGIGPAESSEIDKVTGKLKLL